MRTRLPRSQIDSPRADTRDAVETLLDFLLALRRFRDTWGPRLPPEDFDQTLTRERGHQKTLDALRDRKRRRRR